MSDHVSYYDYIIQTASLYPISNKSFADLITIRKDVHQINILYSASVHQGSTYKQAIQTWPMNIYRSKVTVQLNNFRALRSNTRIAKNQQ